LFRSRGGAALTIGRGGADAGAGVDADAEGVGVGLKAAVLGIDGVATGATGAVGAIGRAGTAGRAAAAPAGAPAGFAAEPGRPAGVVIMPPVGDLAGVFVVVATSAAVGAGIVAGIVTLTEGETGFTGEVAGEEIAAEESGVVVTIAVGRMASGTTEIAGASLDATDDGTGTDFVDAIGESVGLNRGAFSAISAGTDSATAGSAGLGSTGVATALGANAGAGTGTAEAVTGTLAGGDTGVGSGSTAAGASRRGAIGFTGARLRTRGSKVGGTVGPRAGTVSTGAAAGAATPLRRRLTTSHCSGSRLLSWFLTS